MNELAEEWSKWLGCWVFDPEREVDRVWGKRPHWGQPATMTFITVRTLDSVPAAQVKLWRAEMTDWLRRMGIAIGVDAQLPHVNALPAKLRSAYLSLRAVSWLSYLDRGWGACALRQREVAEIVLNALLFFDEQRYFLDCVIVMPNHVHILVQFAPGIDMRKQCQGWLSYTARKINEHLGRSGRFWRSEPFDHLIRTENQLNHVRNYIQTNGERAGLRSTDYLFWQR